jgi:hypothetical protein
MTGFVSAPLGIAYHVHSSSTTVYLRASRRRRRVFASAPADGFRGLRDLNPHAGTKRRRGRLSSPGSGMSSLPRLSMGLPADSRRRCTDNRLTIGPRCHFALWSVHPSSNQATVTVENVAARLRMRFAYIPEIGVGARSRQSRSLLVRRMPDDGRAHPRRTRPDASLVAYACRETPSLACPPPRSHRIRLVVPGRESGIHLRGMGLSGCWQPRAGLIAGCRGRLQTPALTPRPSARLNTRGIPLSPVDRRAIGADPSATPSPPPPPPPPGIGMPPATFVVWPG